MSSHIFILFSLVLVSFIYIQNILNMWNYPTKWIDHLTIKFAVRITKYHNTVNKGHKEDLKKSTTVISVI